MAATLTLCASRKMLSSVCLLPMPLAFHCSMLNVLSDMVGVWVGLGGSEGVVASYRRYKSRHWLYDIPQRFEDQNILNVHNASILYITQVAGTLASDVLEAYKAGVPWRSRVRCTSPARDNIRRSGS